MLTICHVSAIDMHTAEAALLYVDQSTLLQKVDTLILRLQHSSKTVFAHMPEPDST